MYKTCAFSGHRNLIDGDLDISLLDRVVLNLIKNGTTEFLCGMAIGFDLTAAESVISFKKDYDIKLTACIPCATHSERISVRSKQRYERILNCCDEVITLSDDYYKGCMLVRDRYMVDNSDVLVCYLRRKSGGTFYTVNYAKKSGKKIIEL